MASVECPHCSAYTAAKPVVVEQTVDLGHEAGTSLEANVSITVQGVSIVGCEACRRLFVVQYDRAVWPLVSPSAPDAVPAKVREAYEDARLAHAAGANIGALMAARTTLVRFLRDKGVSSFKELVDQQIITPAIYGGVDQLRLWAAIAGHDDIDNRHF